MDETEQSEFQRACEERDRHQSAYLKSYAFVDAAVGPGQAAERAFSLCRIYVHHLASALAQRELDRCDHLMAGVEGAMDAWAAARSHEQVKTRWIS